MEKYQYITEDVKLGKDVKISQFVNLYGCTIGDNSKIGAFTEIQKDVVVGANCKICTNTVLCTGVKIGNNCFIGNGTVFINDNHPRAVNEDGELETFSDWKDRYQEVVIMDDVSIGSNCTILGGVTIHKGAVVGAGSVVTHDIPEGETWCGEPASRLQK